jgi:hypothetical protein
MIHSISSSSDMNCGSPIAAGVVFSGFAGGAAGFLGAWAGDFGPAIG